MTGNRSQHHRSERHNHSTSMLTEHEHSAYHFSTRLVGMQRDWRRRGNERKRETPCYTCILTYMQTFLIVRIMENASASLYLHTSLSIEEGRASSLIGWNYEHHALINAIQLCYSTSKRSDHPFAILSITHSLRSLP